MAGQSITCQPLSFNRRHVPGQVVAIIRSGKYDLPTITREDWPLAARLPKLLQPVLIGSMASRMRNYRVVWERMCTTSGTISFDAARVTAGVEPGMQNTIAFCRVPAVARERRAAVPISS